MSFLSQIVLSKIFLRPQTTPDTQRVAPANAEEAASTNVERVAADTRLFAAALNGRADEVLRLLDFGAFPGRGIHAAAMNGHTDVLEILLRFGADPDFHIGDGKTPLMVAAKWGHRDAVVVLLQARADVCARDPVGETALTLALERGRHDVLPALLAAGALSCEGGTCVAEAVRRGYGDAVMFAAAKLGHALGVTRLLRAGADADARDARGQTPLAVAAVWGHADVVRTLLAAGANVNSQNVNLWTPLMLAAYDGRVAVVRTLLEAGADFNLCADCECTALIHAFAPHEAVPHEDRSACIAALRAAGATE